MIPFSQILSVESASSDTLVDSIVALYPCPLRWALISKASLLGIEPGLEGLADELCPVLILPLLVQKLDRNAGHTA